MKRILKYQLSVGAQDLYVGPDAQVLHVAYQSMPGAYAVPCIWVLADPAASGLLRLFVALTGDFAPDDADPVGSMVSPDGAVVLHVFRRRQ